MAEPSKSKKYHYTYEITNIYNGMRYIGARSSKKPPHLDTKYMGTSDTLAAAIKEEGLSHFSKLILAVFPTREKALAYEVFLHERFAVDKDPMFYNAVMLEIHKNTAGTWKRALNLSAPKELSPIDPSWQKNYCM